MAYNLPPPWDGGWALPENVKDEGLERHGYVTKWAPRGTYDDPKVGTGGYAVPQYVMDEGYGQGTFTTKWAPRGSYQGPAVPNWIQQRPTLVADRVLPGGAQQLTIQRRISSARALSGRAGMHGLGAISGESPMPMPFQTFGMRAAKAVLSRVGMLSPAKRNHALKGVLDKIDPKLWGKLNSLTVQLTHTGMDRQQATLAALAQLFSSGVAAEIVQAGLSGFAPQPRSLLGLGCYGCAIALGATTGAQSLLSPTISKATGTTVAARTATQLYNCDGYTYVAATSTVPAHWERVRVGQTPIPGPAGLACPTTRTPAPQQAAAPTFEHIKVGDAFTFPGPLPNDPPEPSDTQPLIVVHDPKVIPTPWIKILHDLATPADAYMALNQPAKVIDYPLSVAQVAPWLARLGIGPDTRFSPAALGMGYVIQDETGVTRWGPSPALVAKTKHPKTGDDLGVFVSISAANGGLPDDTNPAVMRMWLAKVPNGGGILGAIWDAVVAVVSVIVDAAEDVAQAVVDGVKAVGDLACDLINSSAGSLAAQGAAAAYGAPPQAGAAGINVARASACKPPPPPPPPSSTGGILLPVAILGGAALFAVVVLKKKKKAPTP